MHIDREICYTVIHMFIACDHQVINKQILGSSWFFQVWGVSVGHTFGRRSLTFNTPQRVKYICLTIRPSNVRPRVTGCVSRETSHWDMLAYKTTRLGYVFVVLSLGAVTCWLMRLQDWSEYNVCCVVTVFWNFLSGPWWASNRHWGSGPCEITN